MSSAEEMTRPGPGTRSGAVTAVAIVNFVWGGLQLIVGLLVIIVGGTIIGLATSSAAQGQGLDPAQAAQARQATAAVGGGYPHGFGRGYGNLFDDCRRA